MKDAKAVLFLILFSTLAASISPILETGIKLTSYPLSINTFSPISPTVGSLLEYNSPFRNLHVFNVALCSLFDVIT